MNVGKVVQVIGPTVDVAFDPDKLTQLLNAIQIKDEKAGIDVTVEAALHVQRAQLLVAATGERPEVLNSRVPQDPTRDSRVSDIRALELAAVMGCTPNRARTLAYEARVLVTEVPQVLDAVRSGQASPYQSQPRPGVVPVPSGHLRVGPRACARVGKRVG